MLTLDVGCGIIQQGHINIDIEKPKVINGNFIKADGQYLPFRNNVFDTVYCFHVIEHIKNPYLLIDELVRVAKGKIEIRCPYRFSGIAKSKEHKHYFKGLVYCKNKYIFPSLAFTFHISIINNKIFCFLI